MVNTLWNVFLTIGLLFLIFLVVECFGKAIYDLVIGNRKEAKKKEQQKQELEKKKKEIFEDFSKIIEGLKENNEEPAKDEEKSE